MTASLALTWPCAAIPYCTCSDIACREGCSLAERALDGGLADIFVPHVSLAQHGADRANGGRPYVLKAERLSVDAANPARDRPQLGTLGVVVQLFSPSLFAKNNERRGEQCEAGKLDPQEAFS